MSGRERPIGARWRERAFREVFLACFPDPQRAGAGRQLGKWIHDDLTSKGLLEQGSAEPRDLLRGLRADLEVAEAVLAEIARAGDPEPEGADIELVEAARAFRVEVRDLAVRINALLKGRALRPPTSGSSEVVS